VRALSIRQPYAELILRGIKTAELRSRSTSIVGERFYIYACKKKLSVASCQLPVKAWSDDLRVGSPPAWMIELAEQVKMIEPELLTAGALLPTGVIVGSAVIERVSQADDMYRWHLTGVERARKLRKPRGHPQPVWFKPF
jgi:predicted transcriptional regulator